MISTKLERGGLELNGRRCRQQTRLMIPAGILRLPCLLALLRNYELLRMRPEKPGSHPHKTHLIKNGPVSISNCLLDDIDVAISQYIGNPDRDLGNADGMVKTIPESSPVDLSDRIVDFNSII